MGAFDHLEWTYDGTFEQLFGLGSGEFEQKFFQKFKGPGVARGGMLKLRFDWYISFVQFSNWTVRVGISILSTRSNTAPLMCRTQLNKVPL